MRKLLSAILTLGIIFTLSGIAQADVVFNQGFETGTAGFSSGGDYGGIQRVSSGTNGMTSAAGGYHAIVTDTSAGPYTFFDGSRGTWPGSYFSQIDVYLDTSWADGSGFEWSVASYGSDGNHQRDFIFHIAKDTSSGSLYVGGSNNSNFSVRQDLENINSYQVSESGWYTFQHLFREQSGSLAVDLNLIKDGNILFTETRFNPADTIPGEVGGNGYGWFTDITLDGGLALDNVILDVPQAAVPVPAAVWLLGSGLMGLIGVRRKMKK